ncbi:hypothetical protein PRN20_06495 [Devosia sp. ZB163]|jgi:hypothetical protein|nr:hypothetical protein [Devosia sp. ZB163]MDC9823375.1 hypothetical protein [Devosia sp. ZB163]
MKHEGPMFSNALPDAPLQMPKQVLERRRVSLFTALRAAFAAALPRF